MILLDSSDTLQTFLGGAVTTNQGVLYAAFADIADDSSTFAPGCSSGATNSTTAVDWVTSPAVGSKRQIKYLSLFNADTVDMVATVRVVDNAVNRILCTVTLATGERLEYNVDTGFRTVSASGATVAVAWGDISGVLSAQTDLQAALDAKEDDITAGTTAQFLRGDKTMADTLIGDGGGTLFLFRYSNDTAPFQIISEKARGSLSVPTAVSADDVLATIQGRGYHSGGAFGGNMADIQIRASEGFTSTAQGTKVRVRTTLTGTTSLAAALEIDADRHVVPGSGSAQDVGLAATRWRNMYADGFFIGSSNLAVGYKEIPQNSQSAAYTLVLADSGKHIFHPSADTMARIWTIPANSSVAYPIGTAVTFVNQNAAGVITIAITTDTMRLAGTGGTGSRTLAANGIATALKVTSTEWIISGTGLT